MVPFLIIKINNSQNKISKHITPIVIGGAIVGHVRKTKETHRRTNKSLSAPERKTIMTKLTVDIGVRGMFTRQLWNMRQKLCA